MNTALELRAVVKRYGRLTALNGLDLSVPAGSLFALVGSNGAGKTTAMSVALGLLRIARGEVNLLESGRFRPSRHAGRVALLPQDAALPPHARVEQLLLYYGRLQGLSGATLRRCVDEVLDWVHLADRRRATVRTLSHGMRRRLTIAQAFLGRPDLVLLDEPMSGLDPREAARVRAILGRRRGAQTIVISSHNLHELETLCDRVAFIEHGRLVRQDSMEQVTHRAGRITYRLRPGPIPLDELRRAAPAVQWESDPVAGTLNATFPAGTSTVESVNAAVLPALLRADAAILEVRRGSDLESEYLAASADPEPPTSPPGTRTSSA